MISIKENMIEILIVLKASIVLFLYYSFESIYIFLAQFAPNKSAFHAGMMDAKDIVSLIFSIVVLLIATLKLIKQYKNRNT